MPASGDNLSLVLHKKDVLRLEQRPIPSAGKGEVLIAIHSVGICGSDVHYWINGRIGDFVLKAPMILGHETSGTIIEIGEGVTDLKPGDRVATEVGIPCRTCEFCRTGKYNQCPEMKFAATPPVDGTLTRYYVHPADYCYKLPDHVTFEEGAFLEPLSVGVSACRRGKIRMGDYVLVLGAGPIGLVSMLTAKAVGAYKICVTDIDKKRLEFAKTMGADYTVLVDTEDTAVLIDRIVAQLGCRPRVTIECCGAESSIRLGLLVTQNSGRLVLVGMGPAEVKVPLLNAAIREVDIIGNFRYCNCYPAALALVASGKVNVLPLITHRFALEDSLEAFEVAHTGRGNPIKVMINCSKTK